MENLKKDVNNEIDRYAQDFDNSDSVNLSLSQDDFFAIAATLKIFSELHKSERDSVLFHKCFNIAMNMCLDDELALDDGCVVYKHG